MMTWRLGASRELKIRPSLPDSDGALAWRVMAIRGLSEDLSVKRLATGEGALGLLREEVFRFTMRGWKGNPDDFFGRTVGRREILAERRKILKDDPRLYLAYTEEADEAVRAMSRQPWAPSISEALVGSDALFRLGTDLECDFLLLGEADRKLKVLAGVVCFPSNWGFPRTLTKSIGEVHGVVPGLNEALGEKIDRFLRRLRPGESWQRFNWGLSRSDERNQHPSLSLTRLDDVETLGSIFWRVELQIFFRLPETAALIFGIRPVSVPLEKFAADPVALRSLEKQLVTMPAALREYKGMARSYAAVMERIRALRGHKDPNDD